MQPVLGRALGRPVCRRRPVDGYRQNPPSWNAKTRPEDGKTALCINLCFAPNPANTSTPERKNVKTKSKLRAMLINCNSVKSNNKISQLQATIHATDPDIILLVETKLDSSISTYSFLPFNYEAIRNDRNIHGGGVLIAVRTDIIADPQDKLNTACEIIWTKVHFLHKKAIYIASYQRAYIYKR